MQSTIKLFWHLYDHLPPLFPEEVTLEMKNELENLEKSKVNLEDIENKMIRFGYDIWPWTQAYKYFLDIAGEQLGEHFLSPQMSSGLQKKYLNFKVYGGGLKDLQTGRAAGFFTPEERAELCEGLVNMHLQLKSYVTRDLVGVNKKKYFEKIDEYEKLLEKIKTNLESLRAMVAKEEGGSVLANEINSKIRDFEHSLCLLGTEMDYEAVCQAPDFFAGRKVELSRLRGIHIPMQIDFLNS
jgi:hypothetical protein